jgi:uncharacterized protein (TIGR03437 family)
MATHGAYLCVIALCGGELMLGQSYSVRTIAGRTMSADDVPAISSLLRRPRKVAADRSGNVYVLDTGDSRVRVISGAGRINTVAGGNNGCLTDGGPAVKACLDRPVSLAIDSLGNLFIGEDAGRILKVDGATGTISWFAGKGTAGFSGDGLPALSAAFHPDDLTVDSRGNLLIADSVNRRVLRIDVRTGILTLIAGAGGTNYSSEESSALASNLESPVQVRADASGNVFVSDRFRSAIRKISPEGRISTILQGAPAQFQSAMHLDAKGTLFLGTAGAVWKLAAGAPAWSRIAGKDGFLSSSGDGGAAVDATLSAINDLTTDTAGRLLILDSTLRRIEDSGLIQTIAGSNPSIGSGAVPLASATLNFPTGGVVDRTGAIIVAQNLGKSLHWIENGVVNQRFFIDFSGTGSGPVCFQLEAPHSLAMMPDGTVFVSDENASLIYKLDQFNRGGIFGGRCRIFGYSPLRPDEAPKVNTILLNRPRGLSASAQGEFIFSDYGNNRIRRVDSGGYVFDAGGNGSKAFSGDGGPAVSAGLDPNDVATDKAGNIYVADTSNHRIRRIDKATGRITTVAGNGSPGFSGDGGNATSAQLNRPTGIELDGAGILYIADWGNARVRKVDLTGAISTIAGTGDSHFNGEAGTALLTNISPYDVFVDGPGNIYIVDRENDRIRMLSVVAATAIVAVEGNGQQGLAGTELAMPLVVRVAGSGGIPVNAATVDFRVESGGATVSPSRVTTGADGIAKAAVRLGENPGSIVIVATVAGLPSVRFTATAVSGAVTPRISGVAGAGSSTPPVQKLAPLGIASIYGSDFAPPRTLRVLETSDLVGGKMPANLAQTCVEVGGVRAPLFLVAGGQINFQVPVVPQGEAVETRVLRGCGTAEEIRSSAFPIRVVNSAPEFFSFRVSVDGRNPIAAISSGTGELLGDEGLIPGVVFRRARPGEIVILFGTGLGGTSPAVAAGEVPTVAAAVSGRVVVNIGGQVLSAESILYVGVTPGSAGLYQLNIRLPENLSDGDHTVQVFVGSEVSPAGAYLGVGR